MREDIERYLENHAAIAAAGGRCPTPMDLSWVTGSPGKKGGGKGKGAGVRVLFTEALVTARRAGAFSVGRPFRI